MSKNALATDLEPEVPQEEIEKAAEATADPPQEVKAEPEKEKTVPHGAFHEEREKRKQFQKELEEERRKNAANMAVLNDRLQQIYAAQRPQQPQFQDPRQAGERVVDVIAQNQELTQQQVNELGRYLQSELAQRAQAQQKNQIVGWAQAQASEFAQETPDFTDAYNHMLSLRTNELKALGLGPQDIARTLEQDELWVYQHAAQTGKNPAEVIYRMAQGAGYKGKQNAAEKVANLNKGQGAAKNLGNGVSEAGMPTPEQIAAMSEDEFDEFKKKIGNKNLSQVL